MGHELPIHPVVVRGRRTSIRLDDRSWEALKEICRCEGLSLPVLLSQIDQNRGAEALSTATRAFIVQYFRTASHPLVAPRPSDYLADVRRRFSRAQVRHSLESDTSGFAETLQLTPDILPKIEHGPLTQHWREWLRQRSDRGAAPRLDEFAHHFSDKETLYNFLDVSAGDAFNFRGLNVNPDARRFTGFDLTGHRVGDYPFVLHSVGMQADFSFVKREAQPIYQVLHQRFDRMERTYARVTLPFSSSGKAIDRLVTVVRRIVRIHPIADPGGDAASA